MKNIYTNKFFSATTPLTIIPLYILANSISARKFNIVSYMMIAPVYLGLLNMLVYYLFMLNTYSHYLLVYIISLAISFMVVSVIDSYDFNKKQWNLYYKKMVIGHFLFWFFGVRLVENLFF